MTKRSEPFLKRILPSSLFGRALLIMVVPAVLVQLLAVYIFYQRHWDSVLRNLSSSLAGEVALLVHETHHASPQKRDEWAGLARAVMGMEVQFSRGKVLPDVVAPTAYFEDLFLQLRRRVGLPFALMQDGATQTIRIRIQMQDEQRKDYVLDLRVSKKRLVSSTTSIFVFWMVGSAIVLLMVAIIFLRNQIRPITQLARAAEGFGMGNDDPFFKPSGAREVRQAGRAFLTMRARISRQLATRTAMLSGISHDLKTPLTRMKLQLAMLPDSPSIHAMRQDLEEMGYMIQEYLDFAKGVGGEASQEILLGDFLQDIVSSYQNAAGRVSLEAEIPLVKLQLRPRTFRRALDNLIVNALRYGGENCSISVERNEQYIKIFLDDVGAGIDEKFHEEVFRPFHRLEESRNLATGGVGLGLAIARDIIHAHGGDVSLQNRENIEGKRVGLRVCVRLPLSLANEEQNYLVED